VRTIEPDEYKACARNLREFGYGAATADMIREVDEARRNGKKRQEMPHGIVGQFAFKMLNDWEAGRE